MNTIAYLEATNIASSICKRRYEQLVYYYKHKYWVTMVNSRNGQDILKHHFDDCVGVYTPDIAFDMLLEDIEFHHETTKAVGYRNLQNEYQ